MGHGNDNWTSHDQQCCLVEAGRRCGRVAGNASYSKRIQKTVAQRKLKLHMDNSVSDILYVYDMGEAIGRDGLCRLCRF